MNDSILLVIEVTFVSGARESYTFSFASTGDPITADELAKRFAGNFLTRDDMPVYIDLDQNTGSYVAIRTTEVISLRCHPVRALN